MMVPKLRFAGFNEPWSETSLGKISSFITSGSRDWAQYYADGGDKFIRMTNLVRDGITLNLSDLKFVRLPENSNEGKRTALQHHDILISITAELGKLGWVPDDLGTAYINQHTALVRPNLSIVSSKFIANLLSTKKYNNILNQQNDSGAKSGLNLSTIKNFGFYATNKIEQTKIADFLSSVDEKIALLTKQYEQLCQYKKGIMQQIFSQKFRFKEGGGKDFPEWGEVTLENIGSFFSGGTPASTNRNYYNGVIPFIRSAEINSDSTELFISEEGLNSSSAKLVNKGDILYALYGATSGEVGISKIHGAINQAILCIRSTLNTSFLYYFLKSSKEQIVSTYIQGGQGNLSAEIIRKLKVPTPSTGEQIKIANFLSALDDKITAKKAELDKLKIWKQGLLQQMFV
ncbi:TPA: restriction endonuclease subunit S [Enterobacter roggenkampii]|nr:restriction endonuclease subunit S [Enterobacter roggenkampii]NHA11121.1 restriction endonuclease subunit S [Enterobacter roggenkampii]HCK7282765.1 restriction endonuclease subunit S [Enterobacter roggenkampii]